MNNLHSQNLLANGGFEDRNTCTEYRAVCAPEAWFRIPLDPVSTSKGTAGFLLGNHSENIVMEHIGHIGLFRTYLYTRLLCKLEKGKDYIFTASFRTWNNQPFAHVDIAWLGFEPFHYQSRIAGSEQRNSITQENKTEDKQLGWKKYALRFTATGNEEYLMIGNLSKDMFPGKAQIWLIKYEIDDVQLVSADGSPVSCSLAELDTNKKLLYLFNHRHTPGKFVDNQEDPPQKIIPPVIEKKDTVVAAPIPEAVAEPPVVNDTLVVPDVLFKFDKSELNPAFAGRLDTLISKIKNRIFKRIEVLGHTDSLGNNTYNQKLSSARAETVKKYLIDRLSYPPDKIVTKAFAATLPVATNSNGVGRQKNRRVEIVLVK